MRFSFAGASETATVRGERALQGTRNYFVGSDPRTLGRERENVGPYDRGAALIIDPVIVASTYIGGSSGDLVNALAVDGSGNIYIGGETYSTNYPVQGAVQTASASAICDP